MNTQIKTKLYLVRADEEYSSEKFWDALNQRQDLARVNRLFGNPNNCGVIVCGDEFQALRLLPEYDAGPEHAKTTLIAESLSDGWVTIDHRVSIKYDDSGKLTVSCLDTEEDADDGHAEEALKDAGLRVKFTGNGDGFEDQYFESFAFADWELV